MSAPAETPAVNRINSDSHEWERRRAKRLAAVEMVKASEVYKLKADGCPSTPDGNNRFLSKRAWEADFYAWRGWLRDQQTGGGGMKGTRGVQEDGLPIEFFSLAKNVSISLTQAGYAVLAQSTYEAAQSTLDVWVLLP